MTDHSVRNFQIWNQHGYKVETRSYQHDPTIKAKPPKFVGRADTPRNFSYETLDGCKLWLCRSEEIFESELSEEGVTLLPPFKEAATVFNVCSASHAILHTFLYLSNALVSERQRLLYHVLERASVSGGKLTEKPYRGLYVKRVRHQKAPPLPATQEPKAPPSATPAYDPCKSLGAFPWVVTELAYNSKKPDERRRLVSQSIIYADNSQRAFDYYFAKKYPETWKDNPTDPHNDIKGHAFEVRALHRHTDD